MSKVSGPPKNPVVQPPSDAIQYRMCVAALVVVKALCEEMIPTELPEDMEGHLGKSREWCMKITADMKSMRIKESAGFNRDLSIIFNEFCDGCKVSEMMRGETDIENWYNGVYAASCLLNDCRSMCPNYWHRGNNGLWRFLYYHMWKLADLIEKKCPQCAEDGTRIYCKCVI